ncbi:SGNH/GDSL hydrolase family protein [Larkinella terrae]|uniref:SGNH/GDSL hydrolase family protein n=1 Tax=Larkinella terrae TaxID=2025311 RepID=A0A7K0ERL0_9BACT|nr:SGNH/GDSL hydrolase family protein [Larkinella terrae]MRS64068.1 SGNH/GDSL hydrolase family protein [Larkinella terrae]
MKNDSALSRRTFIKTAGIGAVFPTVLTPVFPQLPTALDVPDLEKIKALLATKDPNIWLFTGDSITHGAKHTHGSRSYPEIFAERLRWELKRVRDLVINTGISGNATRNILSDFDWRISQFKPAVVSLMIGTNDCARKEITTAVFEQNLTDIVLKIRALGAVPILHTPNPIILEKAPERSTLPDYVPVIRNVSNAQAVILVDNYQHWQATTDTNVNREWLNDPLHPGARGHQEIARLLFRTLSIFDAQEPTCGGPYYEGEH